MFHILGFLFFIILVVLVIGLLILSKVVSLVFGFKRRMQGKNSGQEFGSENNLLFSKLSVEPSSGRDNRFLLHTRRCTCAPAEKDF